MKKHWNIRYVLNRIKNLIYFTFNRNVPWLSKKANQFLDINLNSKMNCIEFGSGSSSVWISERVKELTSIEHNFEWYEKIKVYSKKLDNFKLLLLSGEDYHKYVDSKLKDDSIDFCLIDGLFRDIISLKIIKKISPGGYILIDDIERYLPSNDTFSPSKNCFHNDNWELFESLTSNWVKFYFSDGITDQLILIKPL